MICALKIKINAKSLSSFNAIQQALVIDINGLVLNANEKISPKVLEFLNRCNAKVEKIKVAKDVYCVRISGNYCITKDEIQEILTSLKVKPNRTVFENSFTEEFSKSLQTYFEKTKDHGNLTVTLGYKEYAPSLMRYGTSLELTTNSLKFLGSIMRAGKAINIKSQGQALFNGNNTEHRVFEPEIFSVKKISLESNFIRLKNIIMIAKEIELTSQKGCINLERKFDQDDQTQDPKPIFFSYISKVSPNLLTMFNKKEDINRASLYDLVSGSKKNNEHNEHEFRSRRRLHD